MMANPTDVAYTAGLIDGEGHIGIYAQRNKRVKEPSYHLRVGVEMTHKPTVEWLVKVWGGKVNTYQPKNEAHRLEYIWMIWSNEALALLEAISPYLITKANQALLGIAFQKRKQWRSKLLRELPKGEKQVERSMAQALKALNRTGTKPR